MTSGPPDDGPSEPPADAGGWGQPPPSDGAGGGGPGVWQPPPGRRRHPLAIVGGVLLGLVLGFVGLPAASLALVSSVEASGDSGVLGFVGFASPLVIGIALLIPKKLRHVGAGIVLGLSIGMIVGSAACLGLIGLFVASYNSGY